MSKYLELFKEKFPSNIGDKTKLENKPYIGYSLIDGIAYTVVPKPVVGPADNEIWYTSTNNTIVSPSDVFSVSIVSNEYNDGQGIITFNGPVTSIGEYAFAYCTSLTSITIPNSVTIIGVGVFEGCSALSSVTIPSSVTNIGGYAFKRTALYNDPANWENGALYIDNCLIKIDEDFAGHFRIKENTRVIADYAFNGCYSLTSATILNSVTHIGHLAFLECSSLTSVTIPNSVTKIGDEAFAVCSSLTSITFGGTIEEWNNISKGSGWKEGIPATYVQCTDGQVTL